MSIECWSPTIMVTRQNLGRIFRSGIGRVHVMHLTCFVAKQPSLKLKTRPWFSPVSLLRFMIRRMQHFCKKKKKIKNKNKTWLRLEFNALSGPDVIKLFTHFYNKPVFVLSRLFQLSIMCVGKAEAYQKEAPFRKGYSRVGSWPYPQTLN